MRLKFKRIKQNISVALARMPRLRPVIKRIVDGQDPNANSNMNAVYVHFDVNGAVHSYVLRQLEELNLSNFRIVFVTNSPKISEKALDATKSLVRTIICRDNIGYDFGAYKDGIDYLGDISSSSCLIIMNDSVYGPFWPLSRLIETFDPHDCDFWGVTDSWQTRYHLQSYFIAFYPAAFLSPSFKKFWRRFPYIQNKKWIIKNGEIKLTNILVRAGLRPKAYCEYWALHHRLLTYCHNDDDADTSNTSPRALRRGAKAVEFEAITTAYALARRNQLENGHPLNQTHDAWELGLREFRVPFIKRELLSHNPLGLPYTWLWSEAISAISDYPPELILRHLQSI